MPEEQPLHFFIDESGNFDFSPKGSKFYTFSAVVTPRPNENLEKIMALRTTILNGELLPELPMDYLEERLSRHFHATEDKQSVRDLFFELISSMGNIQVKSLVIRKNRVKPYFQDPHKFYPRYLGILVAEILGEYKCSSLLIQISGKAVSNKKDSFIKAIKEEISAYKLLTKYRIFFPDPSSHGYLQVADYINWAIYRKWEKGDLRSYSMIQHLLKSPEHDILLNQDWEYY